MTKTTLRDQKVWFDGYDLSGSMNSIALDHGATPVDATTYGDTTKGSLPGLKSAALGVNGYVDLSTLDAALFNEIGAQGKAVTICDNAVEGSTARFFKCFAGSYNAGAAIGDMLKYELAAVAQGTLIRGLLMENNTLVTTSGSGTPRQPGAVPAGKKLVAALHVLRAGGTNPTLDIAVKSDASNAFSGAETQRLAFDQMTDVGSQVIDITGAITDDWGKVYWTLGGTNPSFDFILALGIST